MLFNSYVFIFAFLPLTLLGWHLIRRADSGRRLSQLWLTLASLVFYSWFQPVYVLLLLASITGNYLVGVQLHRLRRAGAATGPMLTFGVCANLGLLGYYKYAGFLVENVAAPLAGADWAVAAIALPLAISFFTFQQIAYLVDVSRGRCEEQNYFDYCLFVSFFPQLIAGPIVHHSEIMPQIRKPKRRPFLSPWTALGLTVFAAGLFKKAVIGDGMGGYADPVFGAAASGADPSFIEAWGGVLAYTFQIYFDFSGYSDMAIGLAMLFGVRLPLNFFSPYRATNIIDFWRRWHMTLSRFLRDYLYIPLGGSRKGPGRRSVNLMITMLLGGLWHGAGWTFVVWGALHGVYLLVNHLWRHAVGERGNGTVARAFGWTATFFAVVFAWVFFRATSFDAAFRIVKGMIGQNGVVLPGAFVTDGMARFGIEAAAGGLPYFFGIAEVAAIAGAAGVALLLPNVHQVIASRRRARLPGWIPHWRMTPVWAVAGGAAVALALFGVAREHRFIYFQF